MPDVLPPHPTPQALVAEMVGNFGKRLEPYGVKVGSGAGQGGRCCGLESAPRLLRGLQAAPPVHEHTSHAYSRLPLQPRVFTTPLLSPPPSPRPPPAGARAHWRHVHDEAGD